MVYHARKESEGEDVFAYLNAELSTDVKKEFPYVDEQEFENQRSCIEAGMLRTAVHMNLRDTNADAVEYGRPRIWFPEEVRKPQGASLGM